MTAIDIRELRDSTKMTQKEFAHYYDIPLSTLRKWEQGKASPPNYVIKMIAKSLPAKDPVLIKIGNEKEYFYVDNIKNAVEDRFGNYIPVKADLSKVKQQNLFIYIKDLFDSYYEMLDRFERDCRYDEEEEILWSIDGQS